MPSDLSLHPRAHVRVRVSVDVTVGFVAFGENRFRVFSHNTFSHIERDREGGRDR